MLIPCGQIAAPFPPDHSVASAELCSPRFREWALENPNTQVVIDSVVRLPASLWPEIMADGEYLGASPTRRTKRPQSPAIPCLDSVVCAPADRLAHVPDDSIDAWVTSIPFEKMRRYSDDPQDLGNFQGREFIEHLAPVVREWRRTLKPSGNLFLNFMPQTTGGVLSATAWLLPQVLTENGLRVVQELWVIKSNAMPSNDPKLLKPAVERIVHAVKDPDAFIVNKDAVRRPSLWAARDNRPWKYRADGADGGNFISPVLEKLNRLTVKDVLGLVCAEDANALFSTATRDQITVHPARMADEVAEWLVKYGSPLNGVVGDNFCGSGTTAVAARRLGRHFVGSDLNAQFVEQTQEALSRVSFGEYLSLPMPRRSSDTGRPGPHQRPVPPASPGRCRRCTKEFLPKKRWQRFCGDPCRYQFNNDRRRKDD